MPFASNNLSNPQDGCNRVLLEMLFSTGGLGSNPLKLVSHLKTGVLRPTSALGFGRLPCGLYLRLMGLDGLMPSIILNDSSATGETAQTRT